MVHSHQNHPSRWQILQGNSELQKLCTQKLRIPCYLSFTHTSMLRNLQHSHPFDLPLSNQKSIAIAVANNFPTLFKQMKKPAFYTAIGVFPNTVHSRFKRLLHKRSRNIGDQNCVPKSNFQWESSSISVGMYATEFQVPNGRLQREPTVEGWRKERT